MQELNQINIGCLSTRSQRFTWFIEYYNIKSFSVCTWQCYPLLEIFSSMHMTTIGFCFFSFTNFVFSIYLISIYFSRSNSATCQDTHLLLEYYIDKYLESNARWHYDFGLLTVEKSKATTMSTLELSQKFSLITAAKQTVNKYNIHQEWSYCTYKSDLNKCWVIICYQTKEYKCTFCIRLII